MTSAFLSLGLNDLRWMETAALGQADLFYDASYCRFRFGEHDDRPVMFRYEDSLGIVFDVSVVRQISQLPFFAEVADEFPQSPVDLVSPEYNGPIVIGSAGDQTELLRRYRAAVSAYCRDLNAVTEFVRVHPSNECAEALSEVEPLVTGSDNVYIDLSGGYEAAKKGYRNDRRRRMRQATQSGARAELVAPTSERIQRFAELYASNMARHSAKSTYVHTAEFFQSLFQQLGKDALLIESIAGSGNLATMHIFLAGRRYLWAVYLAAVDSERNSHANCLVYDMMCRWGAERGYQAVFLGGGMTRGDALYQYKLGYSPHSAPVRHLRKVHDAVALEKLTAAKAASDARLQKPTRSDYFPSYWLE